MNLQIQELATGPAPTASLIVLHGLGADGSDFVPVCRAMGLGKAPGLGEDGGVRFVLPSAPVMPVSLNGGHEMPAWYDILPVPHSDTSGRSGPRREDEATLRRAQGWIDGLIQREIDRGIPSERIVLMGFSQGCAMTLMTGLRSPHRLGGLVALSGYLPLLDTTAAERHAANLHTPIFMAHGDHDDVVVPSRGAAARDHLRSLGHTVDWHTYPMDHSLCMEEVEDIRDWLLERWRPGHTG